MISQIFQDPDILAFIAAGYTIKKAGPLLTLFLSLTIQARPSSASTGDSFRAYFGYKTPARITDRSYAL
jgi:hypothetical protein